MKIFRQSGGESYENRFLFCRLELSPEGGFNLIIENFAQQL